MVPAAGVAVALQLPLDVIIARKIGAPGNAELAIGAPSSTRMTVALSGSDRARPFVR